MGKRGGQLSLPEGSEEELAVCLRIGARWGFACTRGEIVDLVLECVNASFGRPTELGDCLRRCCGFESEKPGSDGLVDFVNRYHLSHGRPSTLEGSGISAVFLPEIVCLMF